MKSNLLNKKNQIFGVLILLTILSSQSKLFSQSASLITGCAGIHVAQIPDLIDGIKMLYILGTDANTPLRGLPVEI